MVTWPRLQATSDWQLLHYKKTAPLPAIINFNDTSSLTQRHPWSTQLQLKRRCCPVKNVSLPQLLLLQKSPTNHTILLCTYLTPLISFFLKFQQYHIILSVSVEPCTHTHTIRTAAGIWPVKMGKDWTKGVILCPFPITECSKKPCEGGKSESSAEVGEISLAELQHDLQARDSPRSFSSSFRELPEIISCPRKETNAISTGASLTIEFSHYQEALCFKRSYTARLSCRADSFIRLPSGTINIVKTVQRCMFRGKEVKLCVLLAICIH